MADDGIRPQTSLEALVKLKPAFTKDGSTTAGNKIVDLYFYSISSFDFSRLLYVLWFIILGNASQISDGAGAVLLMRRDVAMKKGLPVLGVLRLVGIFITNDLPLHSAGFF
jgi:acetyl-CoA acyltransferase 1